MFAISQPLVPSAAVVVIPLPPVAVHRLSPMEQDRILSNKKQNNPDRIDKADSFIYRIKYFFKLIQLI